MNGWLNACVNSIYYWGKRKGVLAKKKKKRGKRKGNSLLHIYTVEKWVPAFAHPNTLKNAKVLFVFYGILNLVSVYNFSGLLAVFGIVSRGILILKSLLGHIICDRGVKTLLYSWNYWIIFISLGLQVLN